MNIENTTTSFLDQLRSATSASHTNLEDLSVSKAITSPGVTNSEYGLYLNLMHDIVRDTENFVFPILETIVPDLESRSKIRSLDNDLDVVGFTKMESATPLQQKFSVPFAMGIMYVVEGSSLGGRFILKNIEAVLGFDAENGAQYFAGYGTTTGSQWKKFLNALTQYEEENQNGDEIVEGADFAFKAIYNHFSGSQK